MLRAACGGAAAVPLLVGCASKEEASHEGMEIPRPFVRMAPFDPGDRPVSEPVLMMPRAEAEPARLVSRQRLETERGGEGVEGSVIEASVGEVRRVKLSVSGARTQEVLHALLGPDGLDRSYVLDPEILQGAGATVTMDIDEEMTTEDVRDLLDGLARLYGWTIRESDGVVYVRPTTTLGSDAGAPVLEAMSAMGDQGPVVRVRRLRHLATNEVTQVLGDLLSEGGKAAAVGRTLVLLDTAANVNRISRLLTALDVAPFEGVEIWTYELGWRRPESAARLLDEIAGPSRLGGAAGAGDPTVAFVPIPRTSRMMVISRDSTVQTFVRDLISQVDQPPDATRRHRYLYRIQYYDPQALLNLINSFFSDRIESVGGVTGAAGGGGRPVVGGEEEGRPAPGTGVRLTLDAEEDILLIQSTLDDYAELVSTLRMVDRPRQQVVLNSIIAEVSLNDTLEYGVEYFLRALDEEGLGILELAGGASDLLTGSPTGSAFFTGADGFVIIQALETVSDVTIMSQPRVTVRDGSTATLKVGGETPVPKGDLATDTGAVQTAIEYRDTGITLEISPEVNESGEVTLNIIQTIKDVVSQGELGPEFTNREINTSVTVPHGGTLLLGGIIEVDQTKNRRKIPILADIPGLGAAFKSVEDTQRRRELILAITPEIVNKPSDGRSTVGEFLKAARGLERALHEHVEDLPRGMLDFTPVTEAEPVRTDGPSSEGEGSSEPSAPLAAPEAGSGSDGAVGVERVGDADGAASEGESAVVVECVGPALELATWSGPAVGPLSAPLLLSW